MRDFLRRMTDVIPDVTEDLKQTDYGRKHTIL